MTYQRPILLLIYCLTGCLASVSASFAAVEKPRVFTWKEAVNFAAENNAELNAAKRALQAAEFGLSATYAGYLPSLSGSVGYQRNGSRYLPDPSLPSNASGSYSAGLTASQNLFSGLQTYGSTKQAKANTLLQELALEQAKAQLSYDLKSTFEAFRFSKEYMKLIEGIVKRREENLRLVTLRFESGRENRGSVMLSEAYLSQAKLDELQVTNSLANAKITLARVLGLDDFTRFDIQGEVPVTNPPPPTLDLKSLSLETIDYRRASASEEAASAGVIIARSNFFPSLNLNASLNRAGVTFFPKEQQSWSAGASISFPLFSGGRDYFGLRGAIASEKAAEYQREGTLRQTITRVQGAYTSFVEAVRRVEVDKSFRKATVARAEIGRSKYNNGLLTFEDWDVIENDLISREKAYLQSKRERVNAEASWDLTLGKGVIP